MRIVYVVSSQSGSVKRMPTLRPEVSTLNGAAGVMVTCAASTFWSDCVVSKITREPGEPTAAAVSAWTEVTRGPCRVVMTPAASATSARTATTAITRTENPRACRRWR